MPVMLTGAGKVSQHAAASYVRLAANQMKSIFKATVGSFCNSFAHGDVNAKKRGGFTAPALDDDVMCYAHVL